METAIVESNDSTSAVLVCEDEFLRGNFREALQLANQQLREWQPKNETHTTEQDDNENNGLILRLQTPVNLFNNKSDNITDDSSSGSRKITLHFDHPADRIDRAASIALQSWYELSKHSKNLETSSRRFLDPFLNVYTTSKNKKTMPLDLFVVWLRFCHVVVVVDEQTSLTIELAGEVMHHIRWTGTRPQFPTTTSEVKNLISELTISLFTEWLPMYYGSKPDLLEDYIHRLQSSSNFVEENTSSLPNHIQMASGDATTVSQKKALQLCLQYCNTDDENYPEWLQESLMHCRKILQATLREMHRLQSPQQQQQQQQHHHPASARTPPSSTLQESLLCQLPDNGDSGDDSPQLMNVYTGPRTVESWKCLGKTLYIRTRHLLQQISVNRQRQAQMLILLLVVGLGYTSSRRYNRRHHHDRGNRSSALVVLKTIWNGLCERRKKIFT
jgi:hypothetical protein